jgi:hypothetical protein
VRAFSSGTEGILRDSHSTVAARPVDLAPDETHAATLPPVAILSLLVPSRGRPQQLHRFLDSAYALAERPDAVETVVFLDGDDVANYAEIAAAGPFVQVTGRVNSMGARNSRCLEAARGEIVVLGNDDVMVRTPGWDRIIRAEAARFADGVYLLYPNDLFKGSKLSTFPVLSRRTCDLLGDPFPDRYRGSFIDVHLLDVFQRLRRQGFDRVRYLEQVVFEHMHYRLNKAPYDDTYRKRERFGDDLTYYLLEEERQRAAGRLLAAIAPGARPPVGDREPVAADPGGHPSFFVFSSSLRTLCDRRLPLGWRFRLAVWFLARLAYHRLRGLSLPAPLRG